MHLANSLGVEALYGIKRLFPLKKLARLHTGVPGLDTLLDGGLVAGSSYMLQGPPGSGKTILANQLAFNHLRNGGHAIVATLLAESHERLFQYLSTLSFYDPTKVGKQIHYISALDTLESDGLDGIIRLLRREIIRQKATVLVVDGLLNARFKAGSAIDTKKFIAELQGHAAFAGCTVLFLTSSKLDDGSPEHTMVDGVIEFSEAIVGSRSARFIHLRKTRGSAALSGLHECQIDESGFVVFPRIESVHSSPTALPGDDLHSLPSGSADLDQMLGGGLPESSITLAMGPSGVGKTTLGIGFLSQGTPAEPALHFGFYEPPNRLKLKAKALGYDFQAMEDTGALIVAWQPTTSGLMDEFGARLIALVDAHAIKRVLIDSLGGLASPCTNPARLPAFFSALMGELRARDVLVFATWEMRSLFGPEVTSPVPDLSAIVDNILLLRFVDCEAQIKRVLSIVKVRDNAHDVSLAEVTLKSGGIGLQKFSKKTESLLSGSASTMPGS
jgi:circadian clock protein KaiC